MKITLRATPATQQSSLLLFGLFEDEEFSGELKAVDKALGGYIKQLMKQQLIKTELGSLYPIIHPKMEKCPLLLVGCGKKSEWDAKKCKHAATIAFKHIHSTPINKVACYLTELPIKNQSVPFLVRQLTDAIFTSDYRFDAFKSKKQPASHLKEVMMHLPDHKHQKEAEIALKQGIAIANGAAFTKDLGNMPSNICTPTYLRDAAKKLAKEHKLSITVLDKKQMEKQKMGAILGVTKGSREEPYLIILEYKGANKKHKPYALIGKGITFDTGGNSLKPADSMVGMKYDMCGAATVLGTLKAAAELKLPVNIVGIIAAVENMPGGNAYKPEDILTSLSGQTIEVISTDAEGRLILADALTYCERYHPETVIDIATLTGAVVIALGHHATGLLSNDDNLAADLLKAGHDSQDKAWQLPLWEDYQEQIKSPFADMANVGGRAAGTITAACFLSRFAKKFRWAHLDVAGTAAMMSGTSERRATGRPVPLLVQYLINRASE